MKYLNRIDAVAFQRFYLIGNAGQRIEMTLRFLPTQESWMMDIKYLDFELNGIMVVASPNLLRAFKKIIPFGIVCNCPDEVDPAFINDFSSQRCNLYLLSAAEVDEMEEKIFLNV